MSWLLTAALLVQDDPDEIRQKLRDTRVTGSGEKTLLSFALNLMADSSGYDIVVSDDCSDLGDETVVLPLEELSLDEMLRKLLDPHKLTIILEEGKLVAVKRDGLARIIDVNYAPMRSLMFEPPGVRSAHDAALAKALTTQISLATNELPFGAALKLAGVGAGIAIDAGDGIDAKTKVTIQCDQGTALDALRPVLDARGWTIVADGERALVVKKPEPPRGLDTLVRDLMRVNVAVKVGGKPVPLADVAKKASLSDVIEAVSGATQNVIDVDEALLKAHDAPPGGAAPKSAAAWEVLSASAFARGLVPIYRNGLIQLVALADAPAFVVTSVRKAVDLLPKP